MIARKHLLALAIAALVAGCGGGDTRESAAVPSLSNKALHAPAGALAAVSPQEAARQLMDYAEGRFPGIFPGHQATGSLGPFAYRAYPGGIYLGVFVAAGTPFTFGGVYVVGILGGTLASPAYVGQVTNFITPVDTGAGGGAGNGCYDLALADTPGTHLQVVYQYSGSVTGTQTVDTHVGDITTTFQAQSARETTVTTSGTSFSQGFQLDGTFTGKNYAKRTGDAEMTEYGSTFAGSGTALGFTMSMSFTSVFNPAFVDRQYSLGVGQTFNATQTIVTTGSVSAPGFSQPVNSTTTQSYGVTYVGQEPVTVPAGTYNTCRLQTTTTAAGSTTSQTSWLIVGKGIPVKNTTTSGGITQTIEATSVKVNGSSI